MTSAIDTTPTRWWRPMAHADRVAMIGIVAVPLFIFIVSALFGHPAIQGDNIIQNFPLRVLSGRQIASGHLPLFNPYANSGTPLLGGLNAGALYPLTLLFVFITPIAAWILNLIAVYVTASLGMYALLRWHGLRSLSSLAAALSFAYTGAMIGQIVHVGVVQGFSFIPWAVLILMSLSRRLRRLDGSSGWWRFAREALPATMCFALLWGLTFLTGEPRAIAVIELICLTSIPVVLVMRTSYALRTWRTRVTYVVSLAVGLFWGVAIGLVQLLPGRSFIALSQRASISYNYFGAGSLAVRWLPLMLVQDMFGGNGTLDKPHYFVNYNLAEVTGYAGLLALVATAAFFTRVTRRGWVGEHRDYVLYVVLGIVGLFATWGSFTPLGHLFHHIPLFGSTRLQSRNIIVVDFAAAVLLGWWFDRMQARDTEGAGLARVTRWFTLFPAFAAVALCLGMLAWGPQIVHRLGAPSTTAYLAKSETLTLGLHLFVALLVIVVLLRWCRSLKVIRWLLLILSADIVIFLLFSSTGLVGGKSPTEPSATNALALLGHEGRTALVDLSGQHTGAYYRLGLANLDVFTQRPSVQGYGSLITTIYDDATGSHPLAELNPCRLGDGTFAQLRLDAIAIASTQLSAWISRSSVPKSSCVRATTTTSTNRYFGQRLKVATVSITGYGTRSVSAGPVSLQLLNGSGHATGPLLTMKPGHTMTFGFNNGHEAAGFRVSGARGESIDDATVTQARPNTRSFRLDTPFQLAVSSSAWRLSATVGTFSVFKATHLLAPEWLYRASSASRITTIRNASWGDTWVSVTTTKPVELVRSEAYLPGWRATALNTTTGASVSLNVDRTGLIQRVTVPSGSWIVHFHYHAPYIETGLLASSLGVLALAGLSTTLLVTGRRSRKGKVST